MLRYFIMMTLMLMLAACSGTPSNDETTSDTSDDPVPTVDSQDAPVEEASEEAEEMPFVLNVTGAETFDFDVNPVFACVEDELRITTFTQAPKLDIYMKVGITEGTYPLASFDANAGSSSVEDAVVVSVAGEVPGGGERHNFYFTDNQGEFIIKEMPTEAGELFVATLTGTLQDNDGEEITVSANFNIETSGTYFMDCSL